MNNQTKFYWIILNDSIKTKKIKKLLLSLIPKNWILDFEKSEFVFVIGGDGTVLRNKHFYFNKKIVPINGGNLGYYSYFNEKNLSKNFSDIFKENNFYRPIIIEIFLKNKIFFALNEILIRANKILEIKIYLDNIFIENFKGSGLLISTPLGSTGHSKNLNGAIISPNIDAIQLIEVEPLTQKKYISVKSPMILNCETKIKLDSRANDNVFVIIDGEVINIDFQKISFIKACKSNFFLFKPNQKKQYWKKIRNSFVRD